MKLLLIEDEPDLAAGVREFFVQEGFVVEWAHDFPKAAEKVALYAYDCLIVDLNLPGGGSGLDVIRQLKKERPDTGVIVLSARNALDDRVTALELGADDYLTKPFHLTELNARLKALLRRRQHGGHLDWVLGDIRVSPEQRSVLARGLPLDLTPKEYDLLLYFLANPNRVLRRESIAEHLLGDDADQMDDFNFIYSHVKNLRKKLVEAGCPDYLRAVYGVGYKFSTQA
jgi:DNA-binding response OmpR family regulator